MSSNGHLNGRTNGAVHGTSTQADSDARTPLLSHSSRDLVLDVAPDRTHHHEGHSTMSEYVESAVLGMADGLTVPFALTAGLSSVGSSRLVIIGGLAELFAGMISMGLGEWLSTNTKAKQWDVEIERERREVRECPKAEEEEIYEIFDEYAIPREDVQPIVEHLKRDPEKWVDFMMAFELKLEKPKRRTAVICAIVMGVSYFIGGAIPMIPYFVMNDINDALLTSCVITVIVLIIFGYAKSAIAGTAQAERVWSAVQTLCVGVLAAGTSYGIVYGINQKLSGGDGFL
ncbi:DUF125-domain-containing protein [Microthyrium microscopicum]|uniref:DUF125-domain-containing protein n=1 Tax=Microthyrium microscopicum TaxID=703497 RepID=A0A6A6U0P0_9PEZI|nr:DUF125-domain-containing protein [Microthyrium microscopicum]